MIASFERLAAMSPNNPDLQAELGDAYLQKLFDVGTGPTAALYGEKADAAYDAALALDAEHWDARFNKAVSLSLWPTFLGKGSEAIEQFEILIDQQRKREARPEFAQSYYYLGNMYLETGNAEKARRAWSEGLEAFPDSDILRDQLARNER